MKNLVLFTTAFSVSLDSFFCGLSMSTKSNKNMSFLFGISSSVLILCLIGSTLGTKMRDFFENLGEILGGAILIVISFIGFLEKENTSTFLIKKSNSVFIESLIIGFAIGLDGGGGCLSLSLIGYTSLYVPFLITAVHVLLINLAIAISNSKVSVILKKFKHTPQIILLLLGCYKILFAF